MQTQVHNVGEGADQYLADPESHNLTTGKQDDTSSIEPSTPESDQVDHTKIKSMMGKMKDKANKLKTKIKSSYTNKKSGDGGSDDGDDDDDDDFTSSPDHPHSEPAAEELDLNSQPRQPVGTEAAYNEGDQSHGTDVYANASDNFGTHTVLRDRPFELKEDAAAPTPGTKKIEPDYNSDPRAASDQPPSYSETFRRQQNEPAAREQQSAGIADGIQFRDSNFGKDRVSSDDCSKGSGYDMPPVVLGGAPRVISNEYGKSQGEVTPGSTGNNYSDSLNGIAERSDREGLSSTNVHDPSRIDKSAGTVSAAEAAAVEKPDDLPDRRGANPAAYFLSGSSERSDRGDALQEETSSISQDGAYNSNNDIASNFSGLQFDEDKRDKGANPKPSSDRAAHELSDAKDTLVGNTELGESIHESDSGKPRSWGEWASENVNSAKEAIVTKLGVSPTSNSNAPFDHSATPQTTPENRSWTESVKSIIMPAGGNPEPAEHNRSPNISGPLSSSSTSEDTLPPKPVYSEQKGISQKIMDSAITVKDTVASKLGYAPPNEEASLDKGENVTRNLDSPISGGAVSAKDSTTSLFQPGEDEESLSEKITHLLSPSQIKDSIIGGFSSKTTETPQDTTTAPLKGVLFRVTDAVSSILGSKSATNEDPQQQMHNKENSTGEQIGTDLSKPHVFEQEIVN